MRTRSVASSSMIFSPDELIVYRETLDAKETELQKQEDDRNRHRLIDRERAAGVADHREHGQHERNRAVDHERVRREQPSYALHHSGPARSVIVDEAYRSTRPAGIRHGMVLSRYRDIVQSCKETRHDCLPAPRLAWSWAACSRASSTS